MVTPETEKLDTLRHSCAHVLAQAVLRLYPDAKLGIGPPIEDGFYYDFSFPNGTALTEDDLRVIEFEMQKIIQANQEFVREEVSIARAKEILKDQPFKLEIIENLGSIEDASIDADEAALKVGSVSLYRNSEEFVDLCKGPHVKRTGEIAAFKLLSVAGCYWRGDENRPQMQRIYGTCFYSQQQLQEHLEMLKEAKERDHRKLGLELDLFHIPPEVGGGLAVFHPKGALLKFLLEDFSRAEHIKAGYQLVSTPHVSKAELFEKSGHLSFYRESMYPPMEMDGREYFVKPMSCPMHVLVYKSSMRSYKDLPLRLFELASVYRYERSGVLHGLARVRGFTQDDAHIFCTRETLESELTGVICLILKILKTFGLANFEADLSTRPEKFVGAKEDWDFAEAALESALKQTGMVYSIAKGEGAFYAPKIDIKLKDSLKRSWQLSTVQVDLQIPKRLNVEFVDADNAKKAPFMVHRAIFGSLERFMAILIEHLRGEFPTWLSPVQAVLLPVREANESRARELSQRFKDLSIRCEVFDSKDTLGARVRQAKISKVPYILVIGDEDERNETVGLNVRGREKPIRGFPIEKFVNDIGSEITNKLLVPSVGDGS